MDFKKLTVAERASHCIHISKQNPTGASVCSNFFVLNQGCGNICCGQCSKYDNCPKDEKCGQVWVDPYQYTKNPTGRTYYVVLETGEFVSGTIPCIISEMYDDNG